MMNPVDTNLNEDPGPWFASKENTSPLTVPATHVPDLLTNVLLMNVLDMGASLMVNGLD